MPPLDFPVSVGTFTMSGCKVSGAINAFYTQNPEFPRPHPDNAEPSMAGLDPHACGLSSGEIIFCQLSPLFRITLDEEGKDAANIDRAATFFAWAYPAVEAAFMTGSSAEATFLKFGGYVYFDRDSRAIQTNSIAPAALGSLGLTFGRAQILPQGAMEMLTRQGRFQEVTLPPLVSAGATHFAWVRPHEFAETVASEDGAFAYKFQSAPPKYFPVVNSPVFTPAMLEEQLDDNEAWTVVRPSHPTIEKVVMFDKEKDFNGNMRDNSQISGLVAAEDECVMASREGRPDAISYAEWKANTDTGSIGDPWILTIIPAAFETNAQQQQGSVSQQHAAPAVAEVPLVERRAPAEPNPPGQHAWNRC